MGQWVSTSCRVQGAVCRWPTRWSGGRVVDVSYHIVTKLRIEEMCSHMSGQQIVQNALVRLLQHIHFLLLLRGLQLPEKVQTGSALHQTPMHQYRNHKDDNARQ